MAILDTIKKKGKEFLINQKEKFKEEQEFRKKLNKELIQTRRAEQRKELKIQVKKRTRETIQQRFSKKKQQPGDILKINLLPNIEEPKAQELKIKVPIAKGVEIKQQKVKESVY